MVGVVEYHVDGDRRLEHASDAADDEVRDEPDTEAHRRGETKRTAPHRRDPVERLYGARDRDRDRDRHETRPNPRVDTSTKHVMRPDTETEDAERERRVEDDELETEELASREFGDDEAYQSHRGQHESVHFGMAEEPEDVLIQQRSPSLNGKEGRPEVPIQ